MKSIYGNRNQTAFFPYPSYVKIDRKWERIIKYSSEKVEDYFMSFKIADTTHIYNALVNSCKGAGFALIDDVNSDMFNLTWTSYVLPPDIKELN